MKSLDAIIKSITDIDRNMLDKAKQHTAQLIMPPRALGKLHDIGERLCAIFSTLKPDVSKKAFFVMAGDHGVAEEGVSAFPQQVTGEMVKCFVKGAAGINVLARQLPADVTVVDMGIIPEFEEKENLLVRKVRPGTNNIAKGPAMTRADAEKAILAGFEVGSGAIKNGVQLLGTGDMGIANTTPSSAVGAVILGKSVKEMTGRGTGINDEGFNSKCTIIEKAIAINNPDPSDGLDVLAKVGGFEIGGIAGLVLAAAYHKRPVVIDGLISTAGALIAHTMNPLVGEYIFAGHTSVEQGHKHMLYHIGVEPIINLGLRLGEGTGGALAMHIIESAARVCNEVLTFEEAGVSEGNGG
jgi:nicotinate-nucleotide--dimethylbenzimidazole phosphoribosyltransferase